MKIRRLPLTVALLAAAVLCPWHLGTASASDVGLAGTSASLKTNTATGKHKVKSTQKGADVHLGTTATPAQLSGEVEVYYVDSPTNKSDLSLPSPWYSSSAAVAKFKNLQAPNGPTAVKTATVKNGKLAKVSANGLGGISISAPPGAAGVMVVFTVHNGADSSTHRMCTLYSVSAGSLIAHKVTATGYGLQLKRGVAAPCPTCSDGVQNGDETAVDCGGGTCSACANGAICSVGADCMSGVCTAGICQAPTCSDGVENGTETDIDCGGSCAGCANGEGCVAGSDCQSTYCAAGTCQSPTCLDGVQNGSETDIDCGGSCSACANGDSCSVAADCQSGVCTGNVCQVPTCSDGVGNGNETGLDCGGGTCPTCPAGEGCDAAADCQSGVCTGNICQAPSCSDGIENGAETGVDCGGGCTGCPNGGDCNVGADCQSNVCVGNICQTPTCTDGVKNGSETDIDCGGPSCPDCSVNQMCLVGTDCLTNFCTGGFCKCPSQLFTFNVSSNSGGVFDSAEWPGGTASQNGPTGCSITINRPNNNIDLVCTLGSPFSVSGFAGYSNCFGTGGEDGDGCQPVSCPPAGIGSCCNTRPSCSAALNGSGSARYFVQCNP